MYYDKLLDSIKAKSPKLTEEELHYLTCAIREIDPMKPNSTYEVYKLLKDVLG